MNNYLLVKVAFLMMINNKSNMKLLALGIGECPEVHTSSTKSKNYFLSLRIGLRHSANALQVAVV